MEPVTIDYYDISKKDLNNDFEKSFGENGLGLILIKDIPHLPKNRLQLLNAIRKFAYLPESIKEKYTHPDSNYSYGWSHGKEKMKKGKPDIAKGSYYANPVKDIITSDIKLKKKYPATYSDNIWPRKELPELEVFFKIVSNILLDIGYSICKELDKYLHMKTDGKHNLDTIYNIIHGSKTYKGRLLHYFPLNMKENQNIDSFCGWHVDHGGLTILLSPLYLDLMGRNINPYNNCGLYVKSNNNENIKIDIPENCIVIQLGEMLQFFSGGLLRATPHCVRSCLEEYITREQFALFMDCSPYKHLTIPDYAEDYNNIVTCKNLPDGVPTLKKRLANTKTYGEFVNNTINAYY